MDTSHAVITINLKKLNKTYDIEVPLDISANELCIALFQRYLPSHTENLQRYYLKLERPIALLRGEQTLRGYGVRDGSIINITE